MVQLDKLEDFKKLGLVNVTMHYGAEDGLDSHVPVFERVIKLTGAPLQFYGAVKLLWIGRLGELSRMDFRQKPTVLQYPIDSQDMFAAEQSGGWFVFGKEDELNQFLSSYNRRK